MLPYRLYEHFATAVVLAYHVDQIEDCKLGPRLALKYPHRRHPGCTDKVWPSAASKRVVYHHAKVVCEIPN